MYALLIIISCAANAELIESNGHGQLGCLDLSDQLARKAGNKASWLRTSNVKGCSEQDELAISKWTKTEEIKCTPVPRNSYPVIERKKGYTKIYSFGSTLWINEKEVDDQPSWH